MIKITIRNWIPRSYCEIETKYMPWIHTATVVFFQFMSRKLYRNAIELLDPWSNPLYFKFSCSFFMVQPFSFNQHTFKQFAFTKTATMNKRWRVFIIIVNLCIRHRPLHDFLVCSFAICIYSMHHCQHFCNG